MPHARILHTRFVTLLFFVLCLCGSAASHAQEASLAGVWRGTYNINIGGDRDVVFTLTEENGVLSGTFDDATSGMLGIRIESITRTGRDVRFSIPRIAGEYFGTLHSDLGVDGKPVRIDGDWSIAGEFIPITLTRTP